MSNGDNKFFLAKMLSVVHRAVHTMSTDDEDTQIFIDGFATDMVSYVADAMRHTSNSRSGRKSLYKQMKNMVSPLYDWGERQFDKQVVLPHLTSDVDDDYTYEYHLLYRDIIRELLHQKLEAPTDGVFNTSDITKNAFGDVVIVQLTRNVKTNKCVSFTTARIYNTNNR